jgi:hypothetical protein
MDGGGISFPRKIRKVGRQWLQEAVLRPLRELRRFGWRSTEIGAEAHGAVVGVMHRRPRGARTEERVPGAEGEQLPEGPRPLKREQARGASQEELTGHSGTREYHALFGMPHSQVKWWMLLQPKREIPPPRRRMPTNPPAHATSAGPGWAEPGWSCQTPAATGAAPSQPWGNARTATAARASGPDAETGPHDGRDGAGQWACRRCTAATPVQDWRRHGEEARQNQGSAHRS